MTLYDLVSPYLSRITRKSWGRAIKVSESTTVDTGINDFLDEFVNVLDSPLAITSLNVSLYDLFRPGLARLKQRRWGARIRQRDGVEVDTGVQPFVDELLTTLADVNEISLLSLDTLYDLVRSLLARLKRRRWGASIQQYDGTVIDSGVQELVDEVVLLLAQV